MNFPDIFNEHGVTFALPGQSHHVRNSWIGVDCPFCSPGSNRFRLGFEVNSGRSSCWTCGRQNSAEALSSICNISISEAINYLRNLPRGHIADRIESVGRLQLPESCDLMEAHRDYLSGRGFNPDDLVRLWGIRGIGPVGDYRWRILIPVYNRSGRIVSWTTRSIAKNAHARYLSAGKEQESTPIKDVLYGSHHARHSIIICEGPVDVWAIGPGAVCTCGLSFSPKQMALMSEFSTRVICFDMTPENPAAQRTAEKLARDLSVVSGQTILLQLDTGKDPAEADRSEILEIREKFLENLRID